MKRSSTAVWHGTGKEGKGTISSQSRELEKAPYAWNSRFEEARGTNPEELIAAAHAGCFTMKLSFLISADGFTPEEIETTSTVTLEENTITESHLVVRAIVPGITKDRFNKHAEKARTECPVSKALNLKVTLEATVDTVVKA